MVTVYDIDQSLMLDIDGSDIYAEFLAPFD